MTPIEPYFQSKLGFALEKGVDKVFLVDKETKLPIMSNSVFCQRLQTIPSVKEYILHIPEQERLQAVNVVNIIT